MSSSSGPAPRKSVVKTKEEGDGVKDILANRPSLAASRRKLSTTANSSPNVTVVLDSAQDQQKQQQQQEAGIFAGRPSLAASRKQSVSSKSASNLTLNTKEGEEKFYPDLRESKDPALKKLWTGHFTEAERTFEANKKQDAQQFVRWAEVHFLRYWLTGDRRLAEEVVSRFIEAEKACVEASDRVALTLAPALERVAVKQPMMRRLSRSAPEMVKNLFNIGKDNPGDLLPSSLLFKQEKTQLDEWKRLQGLAALCALCAGAVQMIAHGGYLKGALSLRRAYQAVIRATSNAESYKDQASALYLVKGTFQLFLTTIPPWTLSFLKAIGYTGNVKEGREILEKTIRESDPVGEVHNYAKLVLASYSLMKSQQEYVPDRGLQLKKAEELVSETLAKNPDWLLFKWMRAHILRRLGKAKETCVLIKELGAVVDSELANTPSVVFKNNTEVRTPLTPNSLNKAIAETKKELDEVEEVNKKLKDELGVTNKSAVKKIDKIHLCEGYRLRFDLASLHFVQREYSTAANILIPLVSSESTFSARASAFAMLSACAAMRNDIIEAVRWLEEMHDSISENDKYISRMETSWLWKVPALLHRPHKQVLCYELCYLFGYLKWFDFDVAGIIKGGGKEEAKAWLDKTHKELKVMHDAATVSVVYPEYPHLPEEASEELMVVSLLCGTVCAMKGELDQAEKYFQSVLINAETKSTKDGVRDDPFHIPFALYELGSLEIRKNNPLKARTYLVKSMKLCKRKDFSFNHSLSFKCAGALRYVAELSRPTGVSADSKEWKSHKDELGVWLGEDGGGMGAPKPAGEERDLLVTVIAKLDKFEIKREIKAGESISWQFIVDAYDVGFSVSFNEDEVVEDYARHEAGDLIEGFFTALKSGKLKFTWDNTYSKFTEKKVHYVLY